MQMNKNNAVIFVFILLILIAWILFVWLVITPSYLQKEPTIYKKYGNTLSNYVQAALKDKPIADYKIPERQASVEIDISKIVKFNWDKAAIFGAFDYSTRICDVLSLEKAECTKNSFDEMARTKKYFITFTHKNKVIYKEIFEDEILLFGINTIGRVMTVENSTISVYRDMTVKYRKDDIRKQKYMDLVLFIVFPILGFFFGFKLFYPSLAIGTILFLPIILLFMAFSSGEGNPLGLAFFLLPAAISMFTGIGMYVGTMLNKFSHKSRLN